MNRFRSRALPWIHWRHTVETLFVPKDEEERFSFHDKEWNGLRWRLALRSLVGPAVIRHFLGDSLGDRASRDLAVHRMAVRARHAVTTLAAHANPFIEFMLTGGFNRNLPAYLAPTRYVSLLDGLTRLTLTECPAADAIERFGASGYDGVNLAALLDGTQDSDLQHILGSIRDAARPDARIASWSLLPNRRRFGSLGDRLRPRDDLAAALFARDRVFFYSDFAVAELTASSV
jgi:S-adenosylmethionine:diacylglycerol 3-amino-3-carboxypropyl transferase